MKGCGKSKGIFILGDLLFFESQGLQVGWGNTDLP